MKTVTLMLLLFCSAAFAQTTTTTTRLQPGPDATVVAEEGQTFRVANNTRVWFGRDDRWITRYVSGLLVCNQVLFVIDPIKGVPKVCVVEYPPPYKSAGGLVFPRTVGVASTCSPAPKGSGTWPVVNVNNAGVTFAYWCHATATSPPSLSLFAVRWWTIDAALVGKLVATFFATDTPAAIRALAQERAAIPIDRLYDVWGPSEARLIAARPASASQ
jgi:hypothetical protein